MVDLLAGWQTETGRPVILSWLGGEPTLWPEFDRMSEQAAQAGLAQSLTTNGTTLGSVQMRRRLVDRFSEVTVSVDAIGRRHEDLRGWKGGFSKLSQWIPRLAAEVGRTGSALKLRANVVLMRQTIGGFEELCLMLAEWGISTITFNQLGGRDRPEFFPEHRLRPEDVQHFRRILPGLRLRLGRVQLLGGEPYVGRIADSAADVVFRIDNCKVARDFLFIDEQGMIAPCAFVGGHFGIATRDIRNTADLNSLSERLCAAQKQHPAAACGNCMSTQQFSKFVA